MNDALLITPSLGESIVTAGEAARTLRDSLLADAARVTTVSDRLDADDATAVLRTLKAFTNTIEEQRASAKAPALEIGRKIDAMAKDLVLKVQIEADRISKFLGTFEAEERRKAQEAQQRAQYEAAQIAADAQRKAMEARRGASNAEAADRASDAIVEQAQEKIATIQQDATRIITIKNPGTQIREEVCFEVTDLQALYIDSPALVTMEPNGSAIRAILRANPNIKIPGLRHWRQAKLNVR